MEVKVKELNDDSIYEKLGSINIADVEEMTNMLNSLKNEMAKLDKNNLKLLKAHAMSTVKKEFAPAGAAIGLFGAVCAVSLSNFGSILVFGMTLLLMTYFLSKYGKVKFQASVVAELCDDLIKEQENRKINQNSV